jgi:hypothetical protein
MILRVTVTQHIDQNTDKYHVSDSNDLDSAYLLSALCITQESLCLSSLCYNKKQDHM